MSAADIAKLNTYDNDPAKAETLLKGIGFLTTLLLIFALTMLFSGATGMTLLAFLVVWLVPTYLLTRLWRRKAR